MNSAHNGQMLESRIYQFYPEVIRYKQDRANCICNVIVMHNVKCPSVNTIEIFYSRKVNAVIAPF